MSKIDYYLQIFSHLHTDKSPKRYSSLTKHKAPHKPILLLSIIDLIEEGTIKSNFIELTPDLGELFKIYWSIVMPLDKRGNIALPFYHLTSDKFWILVARPGKENSLRESSAIRSIYKLLELSIGARFEDELFNLILEREQRNLLRSVLIDTYFDNGVKKQILIQSKINVEAYKYSQDLLKKKLQLREISFDEETYREQARDQGFRKAIVTAYDHRCCLCGIRMRTPDGHTVVDGAHIIPWSVSKNDSPQNGISLCRLCHWTFDEGLISISDKYSVLASPRLNSNHNFAGHLVTLEGREIIKPVEKYLYPAHTSLEYHRSEIFRKR
jgi:putative restriction endonuclease